MSKLFSGVVKCHLSLKFEKFEKFFLTQEKMMGFDEEYLRSTSNKILL